MTDLMLKPASETGDHYEVTADGEIVGHVMLSGARLREAPLGHGRLLFLTTAIEVQPRATSPPARPPCRRSPGAGKGNDVMISADNFWIELDRLLGASATPERMEALMESYGPVWPDIHDRAINSPDHFRSLTRALVISGMTPQEAQAKIGSREE